MEETNRTDKDILVKGVKTMALSAALMFLGPTLLYIALSNKEKPLYIPILIVALIACGSAIYFGFKGLKTIMDSMFKKRQ
ncbi:hypothetical protein ESY86_10995 [Subsaximicrobium wynnwilliamsii]|uniref:Uncharacterized protein n=1 Tax=Subsaximicrobium wynnwilliamsii TaxID=291179 RepID=A0A5C6ZJE8_9FLAO|nr:DUF6095 family protein [Subsaximicrobium wynnwilliamsii]TXD83016.1 hypothetical protein ESY87_11030 [Subsaximicrobium wynnwilliamsii]TXD88760.1 hypothetical protein ESY86_10995 [Subsaximicrobium wynnwilliamsii]TXE02833.1 hypothetical protein ESY88_10050 [Subsaximicrobium wynnwilliamsii]